MQNILNTYKVSQEKQYSLYKLGYVRNQNPIEFLNKKYIYISFENNKKKQTKKKQYLNNHCSVSDYESAEVFC